MSDNRRRTLTLELVVSGADSISGRVCDPAGNGRDFVGWLGLAGAIEALIGDGVREASLT